MADFPFPATRALTDRWLQNIPKRGARYGMGISLALSVILSLIGPLSAHGSDTNEEKAIISIVLNAENKGEFIVMMSDSMDFYIRINDLKDMGFLDPRGTPRVFEGQTHLLLSSMTGVASSYHEDKLFYST